MVLLLVSFTWETPRMSINLIESEQRCTQMLGAKLFVSVAVHASLITLAVYATAQCDAKCMWKAPSDQVIVVLCLAKPETQERTTHRTETAHAPTRRPRRPR